MLNDPSDEQLEIIRSIPYYNVIVDAVAGSGKTTTIMHIGKEYINKKILVLTYNAKLKLESRDKIQELGLKNIEIHNYHSFCVKYYDSRTHTDGKMCNLLFASHPTIKEFNYDYVIVDEIQDMTYLYYELVIKILHENKKKPNICLFGDQKQCIFMFKDSDPRFLTMGKQLYTFNDLEWRKLKLSTTFRLTNQMSQFINRCVLKSNRLNSTKNGDKVKYIVCDIFGDSYVDKRKSIPYKEVKGYIQQYDYSDIFVLAPSVKSEKSPIRILANLLTDDGIPLYIPVSDTEKIDHDLIKGKLVLTTFHQIKGLERKVVLIYNFSDSYYKFFNRDHDGMSCDDVLYVALTRAIEKMVVFHHYNDNYFQFIDIDCVKEETEYIEHRPVNCSNSECKTLKSLKVTELTSHLPSLFVRDMISMLTIKEIRLPSTPIDIKTKINDGSLYESVSEITGTTIPALYEYHKTKNISIYQNIVKHKELEGSERYKKTREKIINYFSKIKKRDLSQKLITRTLHMANYYCSVLSGYTYKLNQISHYDWLSMDEVNRCFQRLDSVLGNNDVIYERIFYFGHKQYNNIKNKKNVPETLKKIIFLLDENKRYLCGSIDAIERDIIYEFKTVSEIHDEHILQVVVYTFMLSDSLIKDYKDIDILPQLKCRIYNILTDEMVEINFDYKLFVEIVFRLVEQKYCIKTKIEDPIFLDKCQKIYSRQQQKYQLVTSLKSKECLHLKLNNQKNIIFLDIETSQRKSIIQIAYQIYTLDFRFVKEEDIIINNNNNEIDYYKKFSLQYIRNNGISPESALDKLIADMNCCRYIVCHNIGFDINCIKKYMFQYSKNYNFIHEICTMNQSRYILKLKDKRGKIKSPKLEELYYFLFQKNPDNTQQHNGCYDVQLLVECFKKMDSENMIIYPDRNICKVNNDNINSIIKECVKISKENDLENKKIEEQFYSITKKYKKKSSIPTNTNKMIHQVYIKNGKIIEINNHLKKEIIIVNGKKKHISSSDREEDVFIPTSKLPKKKSLRC